MDNQSTLTTASQAFIGSGQTNESTEDGSALLQKPGGVMLGLPAEIWQSIALNLELPKDIRSLYQVNQQTRLMFRKHNDLFWFHILKRTGRVFNKTAYIAARQKSGRKFAQEGLKLLNGSLSSKICRDCFNARAGGGQIYKIEKNQRFTYCSECALEVFFILEDFQRDFPEITLDPSKICTFIIVRNADSWPRPRTYVARQYAESEVVAQSGMSFATAAEPEARFLHQFRAEQEKALKTVSYIAIHLDHIQQYYTNEPICIKYHKLMPPAQFRQDLNNVFLDHIKPMWKGCNEKKDLRTAYDDFVEILRGYNYFTSEDPEPSEQDIIYRSMKRIFQAAKENRNQDPYGLQAEKYCPKFLSFWLGKYRLKNSKLPPHRYTLCAFCLGDSTLVPGSAVQLDCRKYGRDDIAYHIWCCHNDLFNQEWVFVKG